MKELLLCIIVCIMAITVIVYAIAELISMHKKEKKEAADYQEFIESLKPYSVWTEKDIYRPLNPFEDSGLETVTVLETRYSHYDELWVRYKVNSETGIRAIKEDRASDFYEVYELTIL